MYPLRRIGYTGSPEAIKQVPGIARDRDMAQGSRVVMRSGSGAKCERGRGDALPLLLKCERCEYYDRRGFFSRKILGFLAEVSSIIQHEGCLPNAKSFR